MVASSVREGAVPGGRPAPSCREESQGAAPQDAESFQGALEAGCVGLYIMPFKEIIECVYGPPR